MGSSSSYIAGRFAGNISRHDLTTIFSWFSEKYGSKAHAQLNIAYKTSYDWKKIGVSPHIKTKEKILNNAWAHFRFRTLNLLLDKVASDFIEIFRFYLSYAYEDALSAEREDFPNALQRFENVREKVGYLYTELDTLEFEDIVEELNDKADRLGVEKTLTSLVMLSPYDIIDKCFRIIRELRTTAGIQLDNLVDEYNLPLDTIHSLADSIGWLPVRAPRAVENIEALREQNEFPYIWDSNKSYEGK